MGNLAAVELGGGSVHTDAPGDRYVAGKIKPLLLSLIQAAAERTKSDRSRGPDPVHIKIGGGGIYTDKGSRPDATAAFAR
jgi:hypothetical protein